MNITDIKIKTIQNNTKLKAIVSITFEKMLTIHDIKLIEGKYGMFLGMPTKITPSNEYKETVVISRKLKSELLNDVINAYNEALKIKEQKEHENPESKQETTENLEKEEDKEEK